MEVFWVLIGMKLRRLCKTSTCIARNPCFDLGKRSFHSSKCRMMNSGMAEKKEQKNLNSARKEAQDALFQYLYDTRNLPLPDAEAMSRNTPMFLESLLKTINIEANVSRQISRFLSYNPINEFEPFFESFGLDPNEFSCLIPQELIFLSDCPPLLENSSMLRNLYGMPRILAGKVLKELPEAFWYSHGVLASKLNAYESLGLSKSLVAKLVSSSPYLLAGDVNADFVDAWRILRNGGIDVLWIEEHLLNNNSCNWTRVLSVLRFLIGGGCSEPQLGKTLRDHPEFLRGDSGKTALSLLGFLFKFSSKTSYICSMCDNFPNMHVHVFISNLKHNFLFLNKVERDVKVIKKVISRHHLLLGTCKLRNKKSIMTLFNAGKKNLPVDPGVRCLGSKMQKVKFLLNIGYVEHTKVFNKAFRSFRGKGSELQDRFDCIVNAGLEKNQVCNIVRCCPQILNQKADVIKKKIDFLANDFGFPVSSLPTYPPYLNYNFERLKLRSDMYNWLQKHGVNRSWSLSHLLGCTERIFIKRFVSRHEQGMEIWNNLKRNTFPDEHLI